MSVEVKIFPDHVAIPFLTQEAAIDFALKYVQRTGQPMVPITTTIGQNQLDLHTQGLSLNDSTAAPRSAPDPSPSAPDPSPIVPNTPASEAPAAIAVQKAGWFIAGAAIVESGPAGVTRTEIKQRCFDGNRSRTWHAFDDLKTLIERRGKKITDFLIEEPEGKTLRSRPKPEFQEFLALCASGARVGIP